MHLDFYIPDIKLAIECQGEQHYKPIKLWGGECAFIKRRVLDKLKLDLCEQNNISILYYTHLKNEKNENTFVSSEELLKKIWLLTDKFYEGMNEDEEKSKKF